MRRLRLLISLLALTLLCGGCAAPAKPVQRQLFAMDTFMTLTAYGDRAGEALEQGAAYLQSLESALSVTRPDSDLTALNTAQGQWVTVWEETFDLLHTARDLCERTGGSLDITAYPAVKAWGFTTGVHRVPSAGELTELAGRIGYTSLELDVDHCAARLPADMELDLGALAKGWAGEQLAGQLKTQGVTSGLLSLGGNVQTIGAKPDGTPWTVGIQDPHSDQGAYLGGVLVTDQAVVTSGGYERYFQEDGVHYCHIIDPETAAPAQSGVASATIVASSGTLCDAYSTALFVMGLEDSVQFWRERQEEFDFILVLEDGAIHITPGLEDNFLLAQGYETRKVTVIDP